MGDFLYLLYFFLYYQSIFITYTMLTHTLPETRLPDEINNQVNERGFHLYEWISSDELKMTLEKDYLNIVKTMSIPLAIIAAIAGFI
jgi:hypothetical protein